MLILKRLAVWLLETSCEALLLGLFLIILSGTDQLGFAKDLLAAFVWTVVLLFWGSGYLLTTAIFGLVWRSRRLWLYPAIAAALFITHVQFFATGWTPSTKLPVQVAGACIVFACTLVGGWFLRKWLQAGSKRPDLQRRGVPSNAGG